MLEHFFKGAQTPQRLRQTYFGQYLDSFAARLVGDGYAVHSGWLHINTIEYFGKWLSKNSIAISQISAAHAEKFLLFRQRKQLLRRNDKASLKRMISLLSREGVVAEELRTVPTRSEAITEEFANYLSNERGLAQSTIRYYKEFACRFVNDCNSHADFSFSAISAEDVINFIQKQAPVFRSRRVKLMTTAMRSFLQFARYRNYVGIDLSTAVPAVGYWSMATIPKALNRDHVMAILHHANRNTPVGRRDYAILLLLARLGLRAGEVANLLLDDIDWHEGCMAIKGKGGQHSQMPIPKDVGEAIVEYLLKDRRATPGCRAVFVRFRSPHVGLSGGQAVGDVVERALKRAGIKSIRNGAHQLRHALACEMLRNEASLAEIGELLRHRTPQSTMIYAKVDKSSLQPLALPWPGR
jgi:site-specific recombinase XerD